MIALLAAAALFAAPAAPAATPAPRKKVAFLVHAPGLPHAGDLSSAVANGLAQSGYLVFQRGLLLQKLGVAPGTTPPDPTSAMRAKLDAADQHYLDLDLAAADAALREVEEGVGPLLGDPEAIPLLRHALERRAIVLLAQNRIDDATQKLRELYTLDPEYRPDATLLSPQFKPAFEKAAISARTAPRGTVLIETNPRGADVYVDGRWIGASPTSPDLRAGRHVVQVRYSGSEPDGRQITVEPGVAQSVPFLLVPLPKEKRNASLIRSIVTSTLPGARAQLADEIRASTGADAVAFVIARPSVDGVEISAEVFHGAKGAPPAMTTEVPSPEPSSARGTELAGEIASLLEAPPPPPPPEPIVMHIIERPFRLQFDIGVLSHLGAGWRRVPGGTRGSATIGASATFRFLEDRAAALEIAAHGIVWTSDICIKEGSGCTSVSYSYIGSSFGPRLELSAGRLSFYAEPDVGIGFMGLIVRPAPGSSYQKSSDQQFAGSVGVTAGVAVRVKRWGRVGVEGMLFGGDAELIALQPLGANRLGIGGERIVLVFGTRF